MAVAIFKDWFVDFGPTRARMEGRKPYLPPELWNLFPDTLDGEGKPVGWPQETIGDLIVANTEQGFDHLLIGYSALVPGWAGKEGLFSHHIFKVQPRSTSSLSRVWLHYAMLASWFGESIRKFSNGTTVNMLPQNAFEIPEIIVPSSGLVRAFDDLVGSMLRKQEDSVGESRTLARTRDLLLPKLMSGEIHLRDVEKAMEGIT
ncbi:MAG: hypothetical protein OXC93_01280 [Rhodospirillaceae bacterium]|nr:hypothetical protein [Rhodospirillaceae bacterium]